MSSVSEVFASSDYNRVIEELQDLKSVKTYKHDTVALDDRGSFQSITNGYFYSIWLNCCNGWNDGNNVLSKLEEIISSVTKIVDAILADVQEVSSSQQEEYFRFYKLLHKSCSRISDIEYFFRSSPLNYFNAGEERFRNIFPKISDQRNRLSSNKMLPIFPKKSLEELFTELEKYRRYIEEDKLDYNHYYSKINLIGLHVLFIGCQLTDEEISRWMEYIPYMYNLDIDRFRIAYPKENIEELCRVTKKDEWRKNLSQENYECFIHTIEQIDAEVFTSEFFERLVELFKEHIEYNLTLELIKEIILSPSDIQYEQLISESQRYQIILKACQKDRCFRITLDEPTPEESDLLEKSGFHIRGKLGYYYR